MPSIQHNRQYDWQRARSLLPLKNPSEAGPKGALVPDSIHEHDHIAVVYDKGQNPPEITIESVCGSVHKVMADGVAVAVVARSTGHAPSAADVLLVERDS